MILCGLYGTLDTSQLPLKLTRFNVPQNALYGSINFKGFPRSLEHIELSHNKFCGSCALSDLPDGLKNFTSETRNLVERYRSVIYRRRCTRWMSRGICLPGLCALKAYRKRYSRSISAPTLSQATFGFWLFRKRSRNFILFLTLSVEKQCS